jgi:hypothetical protein
MNSNLQNEVLELAAKAEVGILACDELVGWATRTLAAGHETPAIVALAGLDLGRPPLLADGLPLFRSALEQLNLAVPEGREELLRVHLRQLARQILEGNVSASEGVIRIEHEVAKPLEYPEDLMAWIYIGSDLDPVTWRELPPKAWEQAARRLANETVGNAVALPNDGTPFPELAVVRTLAAKEDSDGRLVPAGTEGTIVYVGGVRHPMYTVEVVIVDERGMQCDGHLIDALHEELELVCIPPHSVRSGSWGCAGLLVAVLVPLTAGVYLLVGCA